MLWFSPTPPIDEQTRLWVEAGFVRLEKMLGQSRMLTAKVILPEDQYFPDPYDRTPAGAEKLFQRVCGYLQVDPKSVELEIFPDETEELREILPYWSGGSASCAGLYTHEDAEKFHEKRGDKHKRRMMVALRSTLLKEPVALIATIAHELGHVILLGGGLMDPNIPDHEPMTDLLTVYMGLGIFTANSAARFEQYQEAGRQGWSMKRLGYLRQEVYGYALARFAAGRGEQKPQWARYLSTNVRAYFKSSSAWLRKNRPSG